MILWQEMTDRAVENYLQVFLERYPVKEYKKGEIIVFQGEAPRSAYVIKKGTVKAYNLSVNGDEKPVAFYADGSIFPASWVYGKMSNAIYYYEAFTPELTMYSIPREELAAFVKRHSELLYRELERYMIDELGKSMRLNALQHSRASDKLIYTLHYLALSHGQTNENGVVTILLDLTHQDFANLTGLTRETAATELNKLKRQKIISYGKNQPYKLNLRKLARDLNDQYISDLKLTA